MSIADKLRTIAENQQTIYDTARDKELRESINRVISYGVRTNFAYAFSRCNYSGVVLPFDVTPTSNINHMFYYYQGETLPVGIDLSKVPRGASVTALFACSNLTEIPDMGLGRMNGYVNAFLNCEKLKKISVIRSSKATGYAYTFDGCYALTSVGFEGEIGKDIDFSSCTKLNKTCIKNIISHLYDYSKEGGTHKLTIGSANLSKLTAAEEQIAIDKGWILI